MNVNSLAPTDLRRYLTVAEAVLASRLSRTTVYGLVRKGLLPSVKVPGCRRVLIDAADLDAYLRPGRRAGLNPTEPSG